MAKIIFVLHRKEGTTLEQMNESWKGDSHVNIVKKLPGLTKFIENHIVGPSDARACDGVGELWFESAAAMETALNSPEMGAAVESAKNFLDMEKTGLIMVREVPIK
jgi:uncharacterized protein (TIGR02118 family)